MARFDLLSKRRRDVEKGGKEDLYRYDILPQPLRVQINNIATETFGADRYYSRGLQKSIDNDSWTWIEKTYLNEVGKEAMGRETMTALRVRSFFLTLPDENALDLAELIVHRITEQLQGVRDAELVIDEINYRFREAGVGYQLEKGLFIRVDSQFVHAEVVKPALSLLSAAGFEGAQEEFLEAHLHYRQGENRQAVSMAANAVESTLKAIFAKKGWAVTDGRISGLVKVAKANGLWPDYLDNNFDQLVATLQSGLPKIRDNDASHGQGAEPKEVPNFVAAFALHLAASNIVFIASAANG